MFFHRDIKKAFSLSTSGRWKTSTEKIRANVPFRKLTKNIAPGANEQSCEKLYGKIAVVNANTANRDKAGRGLSSGTNGNSHIRYCGEKTLFASIKASSAVIV